MTSEPATCVYCGADWQLSDGMCHACQNGAKKNMTAEEQQENQERQEEYWGRLMPRKKWRDKRITDIFAAIQWNRKRQYIVPTLWVEELAELLKDREQEKLNDD